MVVLLVKWNACLNKVFICMFCIFLCFLNDIPMDMLEDQSREEGYLNIKLEEEFIFILYREEVEVWYCEE